MEFLKLVLVSLGMSGSYILVTLISSFFTYNRIRLPDLIDSKLVLSNAFIVAILFFLIFWGFPKLLNAVVLSDLIISGLLFLVISVVPTYQYLIAPLFTIRNLKTTSEKI